MKNKKSEDMITSSLLNSKFLKMHLMSNDNPREGSSETKTILNESRSDEGVDNHSSTFEIRTKGISDCSIAVEDSESFDANELLIWLLQTKHNTDML